MASVEVLQTAIGLAEDTMWTESLCRESRDQISEMKEEIFGQKSFISAPNVGSRSLRPGFNLKAHHPRILVMNGSF